MWTTGWMEPCDKWNIVTILTIHLSEAPNPKVALPTLYLLEQLQIKLKYILVHFDFLGHQGLSGPLCDA